jgi:hypothetical protein
MVESLQKNYKHPQLKRDLENIFSISIHSEVENFIILKEDSRLCIIMIYFSAYNSPTPNLNITSPICGSGMLSGNMSCMLFCLTD